VLRFEDFVEASRGVKTVDAAVRLYANAVSQEGYENCILTSVRGRQLGQIAWFDLPAGYVEAYVQSRWDQIDPVLACSLRASKAFFWDDVTRDAKLSGDQTKFMAACWDLNVHSGMTFPFHGPNRQLELISISRRTADSPNGESARLLYALSAQTWSRYRELTGEQLFVNQETLLTARELEILRWCKGGKTRPEIGEILSISAKTVEFHLRSVMDKLGANNQISAVVIALQRGLIEL
jgi:DNA-binding CsgD family transcriptional regulator